jgi:hypothetical protein
VRDLGGADLTAQVARTARASMRQI